MKLGHLLDKVYFYTSVKIILQDSYIKYVTTKYETIFETDSFERYTNVKYRKYDVRGVSVEDSTLVIYIAKAMYEYDE
jgi:hypothetical protein